ncbi:hypothetical protein E4T47_05396 [Aureobasidium subglaciale]|nr:hypothetical protein E4T47_05396 [Aureobasidium subglaciale]
MSYQFSRVHPSTGNTHTVTEEEWKAVLFMLLMVCVTLLGICSIAGAVVVTFKYGFVKSVYAFCKILSMMILAGTLGLHTSLFLGLIFTVWFYADEPASRKFCKKLEQVDREKQLKTGEGIPQQKSDNSISTSLNIDKFLATKDSRFDLSDTPWPFVNMKSPTANEDYSASTSSRSKSKICDAVMTPRRARDKELQRAVRYEGMRASTVEISATQVTDETSEIP